MRIINGTRKLNIPKGVTCTVSKRDVTVTGPRGVLKQSFKHLQAEIKMVNHGRTLQIDMWNASKKRLASLRTCTSHVQNMVTGVTKGYEYKMRFVYAHFPVNAAIVDNDTKIEIRNFIGEKIVRRVPMLEGVTVVRSEAQKDEIVVSGNDINNVSQSAANIQQACFIGNKDIRKFLDGIYVSEKGLIVKDD